MTGRTLSCALCHRQFPVEEYADHDCPYMEPVAGRTPSEGRHDLCDHGQGYCGAKPLPPPPGWPTTPARVSSPGGGTADA